MSRNNLEILLAVLLALFVLLISPGPAITGPVAALVLIASAAQIRRRQRRRRPRRA